MVGDARDGGSTAGGETRILERLDAVAAAYDVLFCDVWGCFHNGVAPYPAAVSALQRFRAGGGVVVLLTNAPRPNPPIHQHLAGMGAPRDSYDVIVSSGDATRAVLADHRYGRRIHIVGPERDAAIWDGVEIIHAPLETAEAILCTGLFDDETETPEDYAALIAEGVARELPMLCANPDIVVDRAETRLYCAGAIAAAYTEAGGRSEYFGKPHAPIYERAMAEATRLKPGLDPRRILAVGDGVNTDVLGAEQAGLDALFVTGGLAADDMGADPEHPDPARLAAFLRAEGRAPRYAIGRLR
ncbi:MAG: TIGR01459 family HAD-type hydrolase [Pseudomonadota bacterium]